MKRQRAFIQQFCSICDEIEVIIKIVYFQTGTFLWCLYLQKDYRPDSFPFTKGKPYFACGAARAMQRLHW
jgi:hypothetical protein